MELAKLQTPTRRNGHKAEPQTVEKVETVAPQDDGTVTITKMEIKPSSSGRERFGTGTKTWPKFPTNSPALQRFSK